LKSTYKSLAFGVSFCFDITTTPSSLRLADSAITDSSPTGCPKRFVIETSTVGFCELIADGLIRVTTIGIEF
jgi:hypothetical protein